MRVYSRRTKPFFLHAEKHVRHSNYFAFAIFFVAFLAAVFLTAFLTAFFADFFATFFVATLFAVFFGAVSVEGFGATFLASFLAVFFIGSFLGLPFRFDSIVFCFDRTEASGFLVHGLEPYSAGLRLLCFGLGSPF